MTYCDTKFFDKPLVRGHCGQRGQEPAIIQFALDDVIGTSTVDEE